MLRVQVVAWGDSPDDVWLNVAAQQKSAQVGKNQGAWGWFSLLTLRLCTVGSIVVQGPGTLIVTLTRIP